METAVCSLFQLPAVIPVCLGISAFGFLANVLQSLVCFLVSYILVLHPQLNLTEVDPYL